jgi:hypothetical protein
MRTLEESIEICTEQLVFKITEAKNSIEFIKEEIHDAAKAKNYLIHNMENFENKGHKLSSKQLKPLEEINSVIPSTIKSLQKIKTSFEILHKDLNYFINQQKND